jgi:hypothetical protein
MTGKKKIRKSQQYNGPVVEFDKELICEKCGVSPAADFAGEILCLQCVANDVFGDFSPTDN